MQPIETEVTCPFCGEEFTIVVDPSEDRQTYIEDCYVCCKPINFSITCEDGQVISVQASREWKKFQMKYEATRRPDW